MFNRPPNNPVNPDPAAAPSGPATGRARLPLVRPRWVFVFLAINIILFVAMEVAGGSQRGAVLIAFGANFAPKVLQGEYWRLLTANFLHIGVLHLVVNSYALYILGQEVEAVFGHQRFIALYLLTGISGSVLSFMITHGLSAGASTSLFGLFGALVVFFYKQRALLGDFGRQRLISLGFTLVINIFISLSPGIDMWGHVGGFLGGLILAWFLCPQYALINPFDNAFSPATALNRPRPELSNGEVMDTNSLAKQSFPVGLFALGLVALTLIARYLLSLS
jgi:membrane associated rhomboid family serine protease